jgi:toxin ParE1/3/4
VYFLRAVDACLDTIEVAPLRFPMVHRDVRRALMRRIPYAVFFRVAGDQVIVLACIHTSRSPRRWRGRR